MIQLIALDLDGTTLNSKGKLDTITKEAIEFAIERGVEVVIATGRVFSALPKTLLEIKGMQYIITSNGAKVTDLREKKEIYTNYIDENAVKACIDVINKYNFMLEAFTGGNAYIEADMYRYISEKGSPFNNTSYVLSTRKPINGLVDYMLENRGAMENINLNIIGQEDRVMMRNVLSSIENISITSSFSYNLEICGLTTSKADALKHLCEKIGIDAMKVMACGDSENDIEMLEFAGIPVAMSNALDTAKRISKYVAPSNDDGGVAVAIRKFLEISG